MEGYTINMLQDFENQRKKDENIQEAFDHSKLLIEKTESGMKEGETSRPLDVTKRKSKIQAYLFYFLIGGLGLLFIILGFCVFSKVILAKYLWLGILFLLLGAGLLLSEFLIYKRK